MIPHDPRLSRRLHRLLHQRQGNQPSDGGNLILTEDERVAILKDTPQLDPYIRRYIGSRDFINNNEVRYCLWLKDASPVVYIKNKEVMRRLEAVREMRANSTAFPTRALADIPYRFFSTPQTEAPCLCIPEVSSERRKYIPIGYLENGAIASNKLLIIPDASLYHFGILTSNVHMAWIKVISGRLKSDFQYSGAIVYNNFPWPSPTEEQIARINATAQAILDARAKYSELSFAELYGEQMWAFPELLKAHQQNDQAVMAAYGIGKGDPQYSSESACVAMLMRMYQELTQQ